MTKNRESIDRIVIMTLESFCSGPALTKFIDKYNDKIALICVSKRFGGKYGSFLSQVRKNFKKSGFHFVNYNSFNLVYYKPFVHIVGMFNSLLGRERKVYTLSQLSKKYNIPLIKTLEVKEGSVVEEIRKTEPDLIISAFFDHLINKEIIEIPKHGVINVHTAPLPKYGGPFPPLWTMLHGRKKGEITVHYVDESFDEGDIIMQKEINFKKKESVLSMDSRFMTEGIDMLMEIIDKMERGAIQARAQDSGGYFSYPDRKDLKKLKQMGVKLYSVKDFFKELF